MRIGVKVGDIMTRNVITCKSDLDVISCTKLMIKKDVGSVLVTGKNSELLGIITKKDVLIGMLKKKNLERIKAEDIMTKKVKGIIHPEKDVYDALLTMKKMKRAGFRMLPVVLKKKLIGVVTMSDILKFEPALFGVAREILNIREESAKLKRRKAALSDESWVREGECEDCGEYGALYLRDGKFICETCKDMLD